MTSTNDSSNSCYNIPIGHQLYCYDELVYGHTNITDPWTQCNINLCSLLLANFQYLPNIPGNAFLVAFYAFFILYHAILGIYHKTWSFTIVMMGGLGLEVLGYAGRIMAHSDPFAKSPFLISIICLTVGPTFFTAAIYLCFTWTLALFGGSRFAPRVYFTTFVIFDITALVLQGAGGGIASLAVRGSDTYYRGIDVMIGGLVWQVISLTIFMALCAEYVWRKKDRHLATSNPEANGVGSSLKFKVFLCGLALATITIYLRCIYRVIELNAGLDSKLAQNEVKFMVIEGGIIALSVLSISIIHPAFIFTKFWRRKTENGTKLER